jgi:hypothetical protein
MITMSETPETYIARNGKTMTVVEFATGRYAENTKEGVSVKVDVNGKTGTKPFSGWDRRDAR